MNQKRLKELFDYHPDGHLIWAKPTASRIKPGSRVGTLQSKGYVQTRFDGLRPFVHQVVWVLHNGPIPKGLHVDHINGDKQDNRIENLQLLTPRANNTKARRVRALPTGVNQRKPSHGFTAAIQINGKQRHLGSFDTADDAAAAYRLALEGI